MYGRFKSLVLMVLVLSFFLSSIAMAARIKDIVAIKGVRQNQLFGYGLVIGLNGSGDKGGTTFTIQALSNMLENMGVHVNPGDMKVKNVAAVIVSAMLPPFAKIGQKLDVTISSIGDAKSLQGGNLLLTPLKGVNGKVYAIAQGAMSIGGFSAGGAAGGGITKNHPTVGLISGGATIEREIPQSLGNKQELTLMLNNPDFNTAFRIAGVINSLYGDGIAKPVDASTVTFSIPHKFQGRTVELIAQIGILDVAPDVIAKIIVNERTGTVVMGTNVRISEVAVAHGNLTIQIKEDKEVSQPAAFAPSGEGAAPTQFEDGVTVAPGGATIVTPESKVSVDEEKKQLIHFREQNTIGELVKALNAIGVSPRDLITVLQAMKAAGALQAELVII